MVMFLGTVGSFRFRFTLFYWVNLVLYVIESCFISSIGRVWRVIYTLVHIYHSVRSIHTKLCLRVLLMVRLRVWCSSGQDLLVGYLALELSSWLHFT